MQAVSVEGADLINKYQVFGRLQLTKQINNWVLETKLKLGNRLTHAVRQ